MTPPDILIANRNEYFFPHPPEIIRALSFRYEENLLSQYAMPQQHQALQNSLAGLYQVKAEKVILGHGAEDIFVKVLSWFRREMQHIVLEDFSWANYLHFAEGFQYQVHSIPTVEINQSFSFDTKAFEQQLNQLTSSLVLITSPNNPTGHSVDPIDLQYLLQKFPQHIFILDAVYNDILDIQVNQLFSYKNFILVGSFSKFFGMPGLRLGYAVGHLPKAFHLNLGLQPSALAIGCEALKHIPFYQKNRLEMLRFAQRMFEKKFSSFAIFSSQAPFFLAKVTNPEFDFIAAENHTKVIPKYLKKNGHSYLRFSLGPSFLTERVENYLEFS